MKKSLFIVLMLGALAGCQTPSLVPEGAWVQQVSTGYKFTEGPASDGAGNIYFTDIPNERIIRYNVAENREYVFRSDTGKANGLMWHKGCLYMAEGGNRRVTRLCGDDLQVLATTNPFGRRLNSPNDLAVDYTGGVYFTDPRYGNRDDMQMTTEGVYYRSHDGALTLIIDDLVRPNGVVLAADGRTLYVADNAAKTIYAYEVKSPGVIGVRRFFAAMDPNTNGGPDGMTVDKSGRVYAAGQGAIWVWDRKGALIEQILVPENPSNAAFGGPRNSTLYITARTSLYKIELHAQGAGPK